MKSSTAVIATILTLFFLTNVTIISLYYFPFYPSFLKSVVDKKPTESETAAANCNISKGEWVRSPDPPYYTNDTCPALQFDFQNCRQLGRPDVGFTQWRWKPDDCTLPVFDPAQFLKVVRGKSLAFVGDSVARNQMDSLICLLNKVTYAVEVSTSADYKSVRLSYPTHNFTLANFWSPFLITHEDETPTGHSKLKLDEPDASWAVRINEFDYVVVSAGHWFFQPMHYYRDNKLVGCHICGDESIVELTVYYAYRTAFRTTFRALNGLNGFDGTVFLRTFSPGHFENGEWDNGGDCVRKRPFRSDEVRLDGFNLEMHAVQVEEFRTAERDGRKRGLKYELLDTTAAMLLRPDGHPGRYRHSAVVKAAVANDCVHWCLPGPIACGVGGCSQPPQVAEEAEEWPKT